MIASKLTSKSQTTIPRAVRAALGVREGDVLAYEISGGRAVITKASRPFAREDPFAAFEEWNSEADRLGYAEL